MIIGRMIWNGDSDEQYAFNLQCTEFLVNIEIIIYALPDT